MVMLLCLTRAKNKRKSMESVRKRTWVIVSVAIGKKFRDCSLGTRVVCLFVSLLSHFWLIHLFNLHLLYQPYVGLCQAIRVQSHQRQSTSSVAIATCEVQVSAADYQTVPTVATGVSKPLCCRLTLTITLTSENLSLYITLLFSLVVVQLCSPRCWHLDSNYCRTRCRQSQLRFVLSPLLYFKTTTNT